MKKRSRRKSSLGAWVSGAISPVFLLDAKRKVIFFNEGCQQLTGWSSDEIVGAVCSYQTSSDDNKIESVTGTLCPPPEFFTSQEITVRSVPAYFAHRDGSSHARLIHFFPLFDEEENLESVIGMVTKIDQPISSAPPTSTDLLHAEFSSLRILLRQQFGLKQFLGQCASMQRVMRQINNALESRTPLFITGEVGTGKEFIARLLHQEGTADHRTFVPFDCQQLPPRDLLRSLKRIFETVDDDSLSTIARLPGTIYFANVDSMARDVQQLIIDNKHCFTSHEKSNLRLLAGSTGSLEEKHEQQELLSEFYYLITTSEIILPPLRQREGDMNLLAQHFLEQLNREEEPQITGFDQAVWQQFEHYHWSANLQELKMVIHEARDTCQTTTIQLSDLPFRFQTGRDAQAVTPAATNSVVPLNEYLEAQERTAIQQALQTANNNKTIAADLLKIPRAKLYRRMEALKIERDT